MMRFILAMIVCCPGLIVCPLTAVAGDVDNAVAHAPFELVRTLSSVQERIARGDRHSFSIQRGLMREIASKFRAFPQHVWRETKNMRACLKYALSGGDPRVVREVLAHGLPVGMNEQLAKGVLAYAEGRNGAAFRLLGEIDARALPAGFGGHVALVQAIVLPEANMARRHNLLDDARLLAPGTLVEESALRRKLHYLMRDDPKSLFLPTARMYLRRYSNSIYAETFVKKIGRGVLQTLARSKGSKPEMLDAFMRGLDDQHRRPLYLFVASSVIRQGDVMLGLHAATKTADITGGSKREVQRANLYQAAALVASDRRDEGVRLLNAIDKKVLASDDVRLVDLALRVSREVRQLPSSLSVAVRTALHGNDVSQGAGGVKKTIPLGAVVQRADALVVQIDALLKQ